MAYFKLVLKEECIVFKNGFLMSCVIVANLSHK